MIARSVAIERENGGDFATFFGEKSLFLGHISLNQERDLDILRLPGMTYSLLAFL